MSGPAVFIAPSPERLGANATGAVENPGRAWQAALLSQNGVERRGLALYRNFPIFKDQMVVIGKLVIGFCRVHGRGVNSTNSMAENAGHDISDLCLAAVGCGVSIKKESC